MLTAMLLAAVGRTGFRYGVEGSLRELAGLHIDEYLQHLLAELGDPPIPERADRLAQRLPVQVHLLGGERWSSEGKPPILPLRASTTRTLADGTEIELRRGRDGFVVRARRGDVVVVLVPRGFRHADAAPFAVFLTIAGMLLVLMGTFLSLDPVRIRLLVRNLLTNLLTNAQRHTSRGGAPAILSSHVDGERWALAVSDTGPGVAEGHLSRLTTPLYRADPSRQRESGGVGLGLYLSRAIAEAHGGTLKIESTMGRGTTVRADTPVSGAE